MNINHTRLFKPQYIFLTCECHHEHPVETYKDSVPSALDPICMDTDLDPKIQIYPDPKIDPYPLYLKLVLQLLRAAF